MAPGTSRRRHRVRASPLVEAARAVLNDRVPPLLAVSGRQDLNLRPLDPQITANRSRSASCQVKWHVRAAPGLLRGLALLYFAAVQPHFAAVQPPQLVASVVHCPKPVPGGTGAWWTSPPAAPCEVSQGQLVLTCRAAPTRSSTDSDSTARLGSRIEPLAGAWHPPPCREWVVSIADARGRPDCCAALKMPMSAALWVPMVWGEKTPPGGAAAGFRRCGAGCGRHGAGGVSR